MYRDMEYINLPEILKSRQVISKVKTLCVLDREINIPHHLLSVDRSDTNRPVIVDLIAMEASPKEGYRLVRGKALAILGSSTISKMQEGKVVLLLESSVRLAPEQSNYVALTTIYPNKMTGQPYLYATKTLLRDIKVIENVLPQFKSLLNELMTNGWDIDKCLKGNPEPTGYIRSCEGVDFGETVGDVGSTKTIIDPRFEKPRQDSKKERPKLEGRNYIKPESKYVPELEDKVSEAKEKVKGYIEHLQDMEGVGDIESAIQYTARNIDKNYSRVGGKDIKTGRYIMKSVLETMYPEFREKRRGGVSEIDRALNSSMFPIHKVWLEGNYIGPDSVFYETIVRDREAIYVGVIDTILGLRGRLVNSYKYASSFGVDVYSVMVSNPYYLTILDNRIPIEDLDKLAMLYNIDGSDREVQKFRNAAYLHNLMMDSSNPIVGDNTVVVKNLFKNNFQNGYLVSNKTYDVIQVLGRVINNHDFNSIKVYIDNGVIENQFKLDKKGWNQVNIKGTRKWVLKTETEDKESAIQDYLDSGLGIESYINGTTYLSDYFYTSKESYFIRKIYDLMLMGRKSKFNSETIEECIKNFEDLKSKELDIPNFSLEEMQKEAVRILHNPVMCLTGPAGSGKTTTAEALVYALQQLYGFDEDEIMFCAPTGKAANRLKEVVKKPTRTIHSLFLVGGENFTILDEEEIKERHDIKVLIVDECSMITLELMYYLLIRIALGTRVIFLGDIEQLPPIGPGKPFATLLNFAPCVVLNVSKRASDKSGITRNSKKIIYDSDGPIMEPLDQTDDFRLMNESQDNIVKLVKGICNYHLGNARKDVVIPAAITSVGTDLLPDDIQIISPVNDYNWGTKNLNRELQDIFNPSKGQIIKFKKGTTKKKGSNGAIEKEEWYVDFKVGDRVIHLENQNKAIRVNRVANNTFEADASSQGIMNGDVGKIEGFYKYKDMILIDNEVALSEEFEGSDDTIFVAVEYKDINDKGISIDFLILYKTEILEGQNIDGKIVEVSSYDLMKLDLAYALTVHKLQGSQAKLVLCVFYKAGYGDFISRNMIYTAETRAQLGVYLIGDVIGKYSIINEGRRIEQTSKRTTLTDKLY